MVIKEQSKDLLDAIKRSNNPSTYTNSQLKELYETDDSPTLRESIIQELKERNIKL